DPVAGAFVVDRVYDLPGFRVDDQDLAADVAGDIQHAGRVNLDSVRGNVGRKVDAAHQFARSQVHNRDLVPRMRIAPVNAVAVNRDVGGLVIGAERKIVRVHAHLDVADLFPRGRVEKPDVCAELIDHHDAGLAGGIVEVRFGRK